MTEIVDPHIIEPGGRPDAPPGCCRSVKWFPGLRPVNVVRDQVHRRVEQLSVWISIEPVVGGDESVLRLYVFAAH